MGYYPPTTHLQPTYYPPATHLLPTYYPLITHVFPSYYPPPTQLLRSYYTATTQLLRSYYPATTQRLPSDYPPTTHPVHRLLHCLQVPVLQGPLQCDPHQDRRPSIQWWLPPPRRNRRPYQVQRCRCPEGPRIRQGL